MNETAAACNRFALDMYRELAAGTGNIFFAPWSLGYALAMTYEGARGQTAEEMGSVLHLTGDESARRQAYSSIDLRLNASESDNTISSANAAWVEKSFRLEGDYRDLLERVYHARAANLDFIGEGEKSRGIINDWVEERTAQKIMNLIPPGTINPLTCLILTNAIYFKGTWEQEFDKRLTAEDEFFASDGRIVAVPMMRRLDDNALFGYFESDDLQILQMPYVGDKLSLTIFLPQKNNLGLLERSLDLKMLSGWKNGLRRIRVNIYLPKFKVAAKYLLNENLQKLGMPTAFKDGEADFSGMSIKWGRLLYISSVFHQAYVDINEEGTEAAAATSVVIKLRCMPSKPPVFRADRPFIFMITDDETGLILFMGRLVDPEAK